MWVETQVLGAKEFAEVVKEWHVSLHCHILFKFLLLAKHRQPLMYFFSSSVEICLGIIVTIAMRTLLGLKTQCWAGLGFGVIVPFYGLLLHGFAMGFVR